MSSIESVDDKFIILTLEFIEPFYFSAHPKTILFIGHGGALSCQEATWYGIPQLLIPFIIDQKHNAARAVERGIALQLDHNEINLVSIVNALSQLLNEPKYELT